MTERRLDSDGMDTSPSGLAEYALRDTLAGDPALIVAEVADKLAKQLSTLKPGQASPYINDAARFLGMIAEIFGCTDLPPDDELRLAFKAKLVRERGRPAQSEFIPQSIAWFFHAKEVEALIAAGDSQKVAVGKVAQSLDISDRVIAGWCRKRRKIINDEMMKSDFSDTVKSAN